MPNSQTLFILVVFTPPTAGRRRDSPKSRGTCCRFLHIQPFLSRRSNSHAPFTYWIPRPEIHRSVAVSTSQAGPNRECNTCICAAIETENARGGFAVAGK
ncbi:unnamed protein product [Calicophoron daubneyi]|uniref:Secreted protein n=1 Tax=Calicophoron daubneyi TaxID=300641 RepID=A0AAV2TZY8_CALDB